MKPLSGFFAALLSVALTVFGGCTYVPPQGEGWIPLFDGTSLNHWTRVGGANWTLEKSGVVHAEITSTKGSGYLVSKNTYKDFVLRVEFWVSHDANSGIFFRCSNAKQIGSSNCYEAQIADQTADPSFGTGAIQRLARVNPMPKAGGQWNVYEIWAQGPELTVRLNGNVTAHIRDTQFASGHIALQWNRGIVKFRKVDIKPL